MSRCGEACRYAAGDEAVAETCDSFCTRCGQGHTHFRPCNKKLCKSDLHDGVRHNQDAAIKKAQGRVDEYTHDFYWEAVNIEDPCPAEERTLFAKCANTCAAEEHDQVRPRHWL